MVVVDEDYWQGVAAVRLRVADLLDELTPSEWEQQSLCEQWRVRDVAGHLSLVPTITTGEMIAAAPRARLNPHRINTLLARRYAAAEPAAIVARIRDHANDRETAAVLKAEDSLFDVIVHSQDIAVPLGRTFPVAPDLVARGADRVWEMGWPFRARRRLAGLTLRATDADWQVGAGPEIFGPALALLLLLTGRERAARPGLDGDGLAALAG